MCNYDEVRIIQYLGSKLKIIPELKEAFDSILIKDQVVVDIFAGTGIVGSSLKQDYQIIANDVQEYSYLMNKVLLTNDINRIAKSYSINDLYESRFYLENYKELEGIFKEALNIEDSILKDNDFELLSLLTEGELFYDNTNFNLNIENKDQSFIGKIFNKSMYMFSEENLKLYKSNNQTFPYCLFSIYYLNSYFSLRQCIEIDSLRYAIDNLSSEDYKTDDLKQLLLACLLHAVSEIVSSVGKQFAQPLKTVDKNGNIKEFAIKRCMNDRKKCINTHMENMYQKLKGIKSLYHNNEVFNLDYNDLLNVIKDRDISAFYIDPPYTIDHYSRFYHIPETLVKYDYPDLEVKKQRNRWVIMRGRYRVDRFQSNFCIPSKVEDEFHNLIGKLSKFDSTILLSYSDCSKSSRQRVIDKDNLLKILSSYYNNIEIIDIDHAYRKLNNGSMNKEVGSSSEMLIICS